MHSSRAASFAAVVLIAALAPAGAQPQPAGSSSPSASASPPQATALSGTGTVIGSAYRADSTPFPDGTIVLRSLQDGRQIATVVTDARGELRFTSVPRGIYVVELRNKQDRVLAVGEPFSVDDGLAVRAPVRLRAPPPWFSGFFGNAAAAAIAAASSVGITAVGSNGLPASPQ